MIDIHDFEIPNTIFILGIYSLLLYNMGFLRINEPRTRKRYIKYYSCKDNCENQLDNLKKNLESLLEYLCKDYQETENDSFNNQIIIRNTVENINVLVVSNSPKIDCGSACSCFSSSDFNCIQDKLTVSGVNSLNHHGSKSSYVLCVTLYV